ncbi:GlsB/YeaQ/YmgE family stress response membrane protein [Afipia felis]
MMAYLQWIVWIVIGLIGGSIATRLTTWTNEGYGVWRNLAIGLAGAVIGGFLFRLFGWLPSLDQVSISLRDIVSSVVGSLVMLTILWRIAKIK